MKKVLCIFLLVIGLLMNINVYAQNLLGSNTKRAEDNLGVGDHIIVDNNNLNDILNTPLVDPNKKIYDYASLFSDSEVLDIKEKIDDYINTTNYDLVVVTISDNNKMNTQHYADDFYNYNAFGFDSSFSGMLFLLDMDNRQVYISTKGYAIKMYDDERLDLIIDAGYGELPSGYYANCILKMITEAKSFYNKGFPKSNENLVIDGFNVYYSEKNSIKGMIITALFISLIITSIIAIVMYCKTRLKIKAIDTASYLTGERDVKISKQFLRSSVSRVPINRDSESHGGSTHSSGSSFHSSGGGFNGGKGRGF